jgi:hypothetical protein
VHHIEHCNRCIDKTQAKSAGKNIKKQDIFGFPKSGYFIALNGYICLCQNEIILNKSHLLSQIQNCPEGRLPPSGHGANQYRPGLLLKQR